MKRLIGSLVISFGCSIFAAAQSDSPETNTIEPVAAPKKG